MTGQSSYWYSSGGQADYAKVATPIWVSYGGVTSSDSAAPATPGSSTSSGAASPQAVAPPTASSTQTTTRTQVSTSNSASSSEARSHAPTRSATAAAAASTPETVENIDDVKTGIESGQISVIEGTDAGLSASYAWGDIVTPSFLWGGSDTGGTVVAYPGAEYVGPFTVTDGSVSIAVDTSALAQGDDGERYLVFFGDSGTTVAVHTVQSGVAVQDDSTVPVSDVADAPTATISSQSSTADSVLLVLIGVFGGLLLGGAGLGIWAFAKKPQATAGI